MFSTKMFLSENGDKIMQCEHDISRPLAKIVQCGASVSLVFSECTTPSARVGLEHHMHPFEHVELASDICGIVLCDKTAHFRVAFYCGQSKAHLCNNHVV